MSPAFEEHEIAKLHTSAGVLKEIIKGLDTCWFSPALTISALALSQMIQTFLCIAEALGFTGSLYVLLALSSTMFIYRDYPFLSGSEKCDLSH